MVRIQEEDSCTADRCSGKPRALELEWQSTLLYMRSRDTTAVVQPMSTNSYVGVRFPGGLVVSPPRRGRQRIYLRASPLLSVK